MRIENEYETVLEMTVSERVRLLIRGSIQFIAVFTGTVVFAAKDDREEAPAPPVAVQNNGVFPEQNFDQMLFPGYGNASAARERMKARLKLHLDELDRTCELTAEQKQTLTLAGQIDLRRFFDEVDRIKSRFQSIRNDFNAVNELLAECQPIQVKLASGLFGDKSFFQKTVRVTLTEEQRAKYQVVEDDRRRFRYRATVGVVLSNLERTILLRPSQRKALTELLVLETPAPVSFGDFDQVYVMYQLAHLPEGDVKPLVDARQWQLLLKHFEDQGNAEQILNTNGLLPKDGEKPVRKPRPVEVKTSDGPADATRPRNLNE